jgi:RecB family exonuclease
LDPEGHYKFQGYIDRLARTRDGIYEIHDYKTGTSLPSQAHVDSDRQLAVYQVGLKSCWDDVERVDLIWQYVGLDTTLVSHQSPHQLHELLEHTIKLIDQIEACRDFPPVRGALCNWCEYRAPSARRGSTSWPFKGCLSKRGREMRERGWSMNTW